MSTISISLLATKLVDPGADDTACLQLIVHGHI